jgi:hypothetical protein
MKNFVVFKNLLFFFGELICVSSYPWAASTIVKNPFGLAFQYFISIQVFYKSGRQVLTSSNNSRLLLKPTIPDKFRLVNIHSYFII